MVYELAPHLDTVQGIEEQRKLIIDTLPIAWKRIRSDIFENVLASMPDRIQAVIDAQGWQTRY